MKVYVLYTVIEGNMDEFEDADGCRVFGDLTDAERYQEELEEDGFITARIVEKTIR